MSRKTDYISLRKTGVMACPRCDARGQIENTEIHEVENPVLVVDYDEDEGAIVACTACDLRWAEEHQLTTIVMEANGAALTDAQVQAYVKRGYGCPLCGPDPEPEAVGDDDLLFDERGRAVRALCCPDCGNHWTEHSELRDVRIVE